MDTLSSNTSQNKPHGNKGRKHTDEAKHNMSLSRLGNKHALGYRHTDETKQHLSDVRKGHPSSAKQREATIEANKRRTGMKRKSFSEEHRQHLSERQKTLYANPEWKEEKVRRFRSNVEQPEAMEKMRQGVKLHWNSLSQDEKLERVTPGILASLTTSPTSIEITVRNLLESAGIAFEEQKQVGPYFVDFFLSEKSTVIEAMGCYWHGCLQCGHDTDKDKKARNKDKRRDAYLRKCGYSVFHIWEHDIKQGVVSIIEFLL